MRRVGLICGKKTEEVVFSFVFVPISSCLSVCMYVNMLQADDYVRVGIPDSTVTAVRMRFPANRKFVFSIRYSLGRSFDWEDTTDVRERVQYAKSLDEPCRAMHG